MGDLPAGPVRGAAVALSGTLVGGLLVLVLGLALSQVAARWAGSPGPGMTMLAGHVAGAGLAVLLHRVARRRTDALGWVAALGPAVVLVSLGMLFWWD